jgi:hypothetical protein
MNAAPRSLIFLWGLCCVAGAAWSADFMVGPELKKFEEQVRQRAEKATGGPSSPVPGVRVQESEEGEMLAPRGPVTGTPVRPEAARTEGTRNLRDRAASYARDAGSASTAEDAEPGLLGPRGPGVTGSSAREDRAADNRSRARSYQQGSESGGSDASADRLSAARERSRVDTSSGSADDLDLSNVGRDGIPVVPCYRSGNTAGRIGDDSLSGMVVQVTRANRLVKVRCK